MSEIGDGLGAVGDAYTDLFAVPDAEMEPIDVYPSVSTYSADSMAVAAENQAAQNEISRGQLELSARQMGIAEDVYNRWKEGYKGVEENAIKNLDDRSRDQIYEGWARNTPMQQFTPGMKAVDKSMRGRGISADSPASMGASGDVSSGIAKSTASALTDTQTDLDTAQRNEKIQVLGIGAGIPSEVVTGYGTASGVMGSASNILGTSASALSSVYGSAANTLNTLAQNEYNNDYNDMINEYNMNYALSQAEASAHNSALQTGIGVSSMVVVKAFMWCIPAHTLIDTLDGSTFIEDLHAGDRVVGMDNNPCTILHKHEYAEEKPCDETKWREFELDGGGVVRSCTRHFIKGCPAGRYGVGKEMDGRKIERVKYVPGVSRSYDLLTDGPGGGYMQSGVPVNSMIPVMNEIAKALEKDGV